MSHICVARRAGASNCYDLPLGACVRRLVRSFGVFVLSLASTVVLAGTQTMTPLVALTATALIMGGTGHPLSTPQDSQDFINSYTADANNDYILLTGFCGQGSCTPTAVSTPEQFMPVSGTMPFDQSVGQGVGNLDQAISAQPIGESMVVFGYSQSARIASIEKGNLAAAGSTLPLSFMLIGNPNRPNGGILERFQGLSIPIAGITFDGATPTNTNFKTVDVTRQYDGWSDFPNNPLNPFATANAIAGINYLHSDYQSVGLGNALYQGSYGDTDYYMIPSQRLPLLMPLDQAGVPDPIVTMLDAPVRVLVESGYDRTISPGAPTQASILYFPNPVTTGTNFIIAIPTGIDDGAQEAAGIRPFGTPPIDQRSPYGVGGPPVDAGSFDSTGAPIPSTSPVANQQPLAAPVQGPQLPSTSQPAAKPAPLQAPTPAAAPAVPPSIAPPSPALDKAAPAKPATGMTAPWWGRSAELPTSASADLPKPAPAVMSTPAPADMPKPVPVDLPKPLPPPAELPKPVPPPAELPKPVDLPAPDLPRTDFIPKIVPPDIPAVAPVPPPVQAPSLPDIPLAPPPQLPALPPPPPALPALPALPPLPPPPPLPNIAGILGGIRLPF
jgi:PE-PPE domain-containing protein